MYSMLCLQNSHSIWVVSCIFQITPDALDHLSHNNVFSKLSLPWAALKILKKCLTTLKSSTLDTFHKKLDLFFSKLHFHLKSSAVPHSDGDLRVPVCDIMLNEALYKFYYYCYLHFETSVEASLLTLMIFLQYMFCMIFKCCLVVAH